MTRIISQQRHSVGSFLATHVHAWDGPRPNASLPRRSSVSLAAMTAAAHCHLHAFAFVLPPNRAWGSNAGTLCFSCPRLHEPRKMGPSLGAVAGGLAFKLGCASVSIAGARAGVAVAWLCKKAAASTHCVMGRLLQRQQRIVRSHTQHSTPLSIAGIGSPPMASPWTPLAKSLTPPLATWFNAPSPTTSAQTTAMLVCPMFSHHLLPRAAACTA